MSEASSTPTPVAWPEVQRPKRIGPYKIIRLLGEGGMGVVYLAKQVEPVRRRVALKVIRPGMDSRNVIARFESERQALALMDHPGVARVLDAGSTEQGRPYFVMEYVRGLPLLEACDRLRLTTRERIDLFIQVARAVQHAHQKGILHRDLKPSNVLVYLDEGRPVPKVIDFGLAKAVDHSLSEKTVFTRFGTLIGTPTYMSPEQAGHKGLDIDTRSDVYSLGVLLYRLLVGAAPYNLTPYVRRGALEEMRRIICEEIPPRPSSMVRLQGRSAAKKVALARRSNPSTLARRLRGDLDAIAMRALEKNRARRYGSAIELASDLTRHLHCEPVLATPPRPSYRLKKLILKHRTAFSFVASLIAILAFGIVMSLRFYLVASNRAQEAEKLLGKTVFYRTLLKDSQRKQLEAAQRAQMNAVRADSVESRAEETERRVAEAEEKARTNLEMRQRLQSENQRLIDLYRLDRLNREAVRLWPIDSEQIRRMKNWLKQAKELETRLHGYEIELEELGDLLSRDEPIEKKSWERLRFDYETLSQLVEGIHRFISLDPSRGTMARVRTRLDFAESEEEQTIKRFKEKWEQAIESISDPSECPHYEGLRIRPQVGFVPIGRNSETKLWEFGHLRTGELPIVAEGGRQILRERTGLVFVLVPAGTVVMGAVPPSLDPGVGKLNIDQDAEPSEGPVHVEALKPFFLSKYEMTQWQWQRLTYEEPSLYTPSSKVEEKCNRWGEPMTFLHPVEMVSWIDADRILRSVGLRLPTECQWEYSARGGTSSVWWTGDEVGTLSGAANLADLYWVSQIRGPRGEDAGEETQLFDDGYLFHGPVGRFSANPFGFHGIHGNVAEWCRDIWASYRLKVTPGDGERQAAWSGPFRVARGGSYADGPRGVRVARRWKLSSSLRLPTVGIRPARPLYQ